MESAGIQVFEVKKKDSVGKSTSQDGGASQPQGVSQTQDSEQSEKEAKIQKLIATATSPRDKAFYQELLQKTVAERVNSTVSSSKEIDFSDPNSAKKKDQTESI